MVGDKSLAARPARGVVFNGRFLNQLERGMARTATELVRAVDQILTEQPDRAAARSWRLACRRDARPGLPLTHIRRLAHGGWRWGLWEQTALPGLARGQLLVNLCNMSPVAVKGAITIIHDAHPLMMPQHHTLGYAAWHRLALPRAARTASRLLTVSAYSRETMMDHGLVPSGPPIEILPNGAEHMLGVVPDPAVLDRLGLRPGGFVLALANRHPHKNIGLLFAAFRRPAMAGVRLVLIGCHGAADFRARRLAPPPATVFAGPVTDPELRALMEAAICHCTPSLNEGFGLPPLEAMGFGCPVAAAPCGALPEVCGDAVIYADPASSDAWAEAILALRDDPALRGRLQAAGRTHMRRFTWRASAERLLDLIEEVAPA